MPDSIPLAFAREEFWFRVRLTPAIALSSVET
jgi:hypothetical protein